VIRVIIENHLTPHLLGSDPREVESLWDKMYRLTRWYGRKGAAISALGALDIAFWDLRGKAEGKPLYKLLGGTTNQVPAYASGLLWHDDVSNLEKEACRHRDAGFRRMKMRLGRCEESDEAALLAVRRGAKDGDIMVDGSHRYTLESAEKLATLLARENVFWFEEPFAPEDIDSYKALTARIRIPVAAGENDFGLQGFREMLREGALGIAQPDACRAGGITESLRVARLAADLGVQIAPHTWSDAVALIANAHVVAAIPNGITVEVDQTGNPMIDTLLAEPLRVTDGLLQLSGEPGLGIKPNQAVLDQLTLPPGQSVPDGNYSDMVFGSRYDGEPPPYNTSSPPNLVG
jgi:L-alanine-DL-glutamate epimerase-like enolase superfamily enzyme